MLYGTIDLIEDEFYSVAEWRRKFERLGIRLEGSRWVDQFGTVYSVNAVKADELCCTVVLSPQTRKQPGSPAFLKNPYTVSPYTR